MLPSDLTVTCRLWLVGDPWPGLENVWDRIGKPDGTKLSKMHGCRMLRIANNYVVVRSEIERVYADFIGPEK